MSEVLDYDGFLEFCEGDGEFADELIDSFLAQLQELTDKIKMSVESGVAEDVMRAGHTLKGASRTIMANKVAELCLSLETMGRSGDVTHAKETYAKLLPEIETLKAEIASLRAGKA